MKLAESDILKEICEINPVILLDDVLSELDFKRQEYLLENIEGKQVFISSCDENRINLASSRKYLVKNGDKLENRVYAVPAETDRAVAEIKLASMGVKIDMLTSEQIAYLEQVE